MWTQSHSSVVSPAERTRFEAEVHSSALPEPRTQCFNLPARLESVRLVRQSLLALCTELGVDGDAAGDFALAVSEAFSNAVRHGTAGAHSKVEASILLTHQAGVVALRYPGDPFPLDAPRLPEGTSTGGRGRYLMSVLADQVGYEFTGGSTRIELRKRWP
jgi:anti-sigma regulatory factor (Ser/Thr protein kinase)